MQWWVFLGFFFFGGGLFSPSFFHLETTLLAWYVSRVQVQVHKKSDTAPHAVTSITTSEVLDLVTA